MPEVTLIHGDSLVLLSDPSGLRYPNEKLIRADAVVTDPPYELGFMGREWDSTGIAYNKQFWRALMTALKKGSHLVAFSGSRTSHRMTCAIEDAGWEVRDVLMWLYGQGFPKSLDISKGIDKKFKAKRKVIGTYKSASNIGGINDSRKDMTFVTSHSSTATTVFVTEPATEKAKQWYGWGTALKPAYEPITLARAPFAEMKADDKAIIENVLIRGTGAINIEGCRLDARGQEQTQGGYDGESDVNIVAAREGGKTYAAELGRWPANVLFDEDAAENFDERRFYYVAKPSRKERDYGCDALEVKSAGEHVDREEGSAGINSPRAGAGRTSGGRNFHPTIKPIELMRWLCRLITPPGGTIIDPFMGSGTTGIAAVLEGFNFVGIEREADHFEICQHRIARAIRDAEVDSVLSPDH